MDPSALADLVQRRIVASTDALGKELLPLVGEQAAGDAMVAMASQHISIAITLLELTGGRRLARAIFEEQASALIPAIARNLQ